MQFQALCVLTQHLSTSLSSEYEYHTYLKTLQVLDGLHDVSRQTRTDVQSALVLSLDHKLRLLKDAAHCGHVQVVRFVLRMLSPEERGSAAFKAAVDFAFTSSLVMMHPDIAILVHECGARDIDTRGLRYGISNCILRIRYAVKVGDEDGVRTHSATMVRIIKVLLRSGASITAVQSAYSYMEGDSDGVLGAVKDAYSAAVAR